MPLEIYQDPKSKRYWTAPQGVGHLITDTDVSQFGNVIQKSMGEGTSGYTPIDPWMGGGGGTFGAPLSYSEAVKFLPNAGQPVASGIPTVFSKTQYSVAPSAGQVKVIKDGVEMNIPSDQVANWTNAGWKSQSGTAAATQAPIYDPTAEPVSITPKAMETEKQITVPTAPTTSMAEQTAMVTGATANLQNIIAQFTPAETETDKKQQTLLDQMASLTGDLAQKGADQLTQEQSAGLPALRQQFADINAQILTKMAQYNVLLTENQNKPITMNSIIGAERAIMNARASDIGLLQAQAQGLQGQISTAQETVNRAIDLKYSTIEAQLNVRQAQLNAIQPMLNREEKIRAQAQQVLINQQNQAIADRKAEEKSIQGLMLSAMENGITDQNLLSKISNSKTYNEALSIVSPVLGKQKKTEQDLDTAYKKAQIANVYSTIAERGGSGTTKQYDPAELLAYAQQYAGSGNIPTGLPKGSFGIVSQVAKELPKPVGTLVDINTGIKPTKLSSAQIDGLAALSDVYKKAQELKELDEKRVGGVVSGLIGKVFGSKAQADYIDTRSEIVDLLARARSGAALTQNEVDQYEAKLPSRFSEPLFLGTDSQKRIDNFIKSIQGSLDNKLQLNGTSIYGYSKVKVGDDFYTVGDIISNGTQTGRVNPDGTLTILQQ